MTTFQGSAKAGTRAPGIGEELPCLDPESQRYRAFRGANSPPYLALSKTDRRIRRAALQQTERQIKVELEGKRQGGAGVRRRHWPTLTLLAAGRSAADMSVNGRA